MNIVIKSETDSRMCLYPLLRCLYPYGSICIITNNVCLYRLLSDDQSDGGFRNIRVIVEPSGNVEYAMEEDGWYENKYDFVIYDNMEIADYDLMLLLITNRISETYLQDILYIVGEPNTHILRFGTINKKKPEKKTKPEKGDKPEKKAKPEKKKPTPKKPPKKGKKGEEVEEETIDTPEVTEVAEETAEDILAEDAGVQVQDIELRGASTTSVDSLLEGAKESTGFNEDGSYINKWRIEKTDAEILNDKLKEAGSLNLAFPKFQDIEDLESLYILPTLDSKQAKIYYDILKEWISVDQRQFTKGVSSKDEGGSFISGADIG